MIWASVVASSGVYQSGMHSGLDEGQRHERRAVDVPDADHVPAVEHPHEVERLLVEAGPVVDVADLDELHRRGVAAVAAHHLLDERVLQRAAEAAVGLAREVPWTGDAPIGRRHQRGGVVLDDGRHRDRRHALGPSGEERLGHRHRELGVARGHLLQPVRPTRLAGFDDLDVQPGVAVIALAAAPGRTPEWFVFGVQSSTSVTFWVVAARRGGAVGTVRRAARAVVGAARRHHQADERQQDGDEPGGRGPARAVPGGGRARPRAGRRGAPVRRAGDGGWIGHGVLPRGRVLHR